MTTLLLYLDYNCFQRGFDDPSQIRIQLEALACQEIFLMAEQEKVELVWSFMHEDETVLCPFPERKYEILKLSKLCKIRIGPTEEIYSYAKFLYRKSGLSAKDALHLASAIFVKADFFVTCDDRLIKRAKGTKGLDIEMELINPVDYIRQEGKEYESNENR